MDDYFQRQDGILQTAGMDDLLKRALLDVFKTSDLCRRDASVRILQAHELAKWGLRIASQDYDAAPERLGFVVSPSSVRNALAVWGYSKTDWIVLSDGLLAVLQDGANQTAEELEKHQSWLFATETIKQMQKVGNLAGLQSPLASFLYFAAVSFFVGHEAGHHVLGHDGHFRSGVHAEGIDEGTDETSDSMLTKQALEYSADRYGVMVARVAMIRWLLQFVNEQTYTIEEQASFQYIVAVVMSLGVLMAHTVIKPRRVDWKEAYSRAHPPGTLRMINLSNALMESIGENFHWLKTKQIEEIRFFAIGVTAKRELIVGTPERTLYEERVGREGELAAFRAIGLLQMVHQDRATEHARKISEKYREVFPFLTPRSEKFKLTLE